MSLFHKEAVSKTKTAEKIIGLTADSLTRDLDKLSNQKSLEPAVFAFDRMPPGMEAPSFITKLGAAVMEQEADNQWVFDRKRSREAGLVKETIGHNPPREIWRKPVIVFMSQQAVTEMAKVIPLPIREELPPIAA